MKSKKFDTKCIHNKKGIEKHTGSVMPPINLSSTYAQSSPGKPLGSYEYIRSDNPTRSVLESFLASLENGKYAISFSSGMAAVASITKLLQKGQTLIAGDDLYGGTGRFMNDFLKPEGYEVLYADTTDPEGFQHWDKASLIWVETPTNPLLKITDIAKVKSLAPNAILVVDNTFMSPKFQNPLDYGADIVMHSSTKYIGGHSDVLGGAAITNSNQINEKLRKVQNDLGSVPSPFDCYMLTRGIKTLSLRMEKHEENASFIANKLKDHDAVEVVYWPGLKNHHGHMVHKSQSSGYGGMVSFKVTGDIDFDKLVSKRKYWTLAESLGGVESLLCVPSKMTHASIDRKKRQEKGITDNLIRLSCGVEDREDLWEDLEEGLGF
tara:strand:+ start:255 stop:1391 length:1137 start_codon:yes stop_codon:yes gene_type:complete